MQPVYKEVNSLDRYCYEVLGLSEDILMENAALAMKAYILEHCSKDKRVLILCGSGNNGADGVALARGLFGDYAVDFYSIDEPKTTMAKQQLKRALAIGLSPLETIADIDDGQYDIVVDALFGSGLSRPLSDEVVRLLETINNIKAVKIACDIPTGVDMNGHIPQTAFQADVTITMGALKTALFNDTAKDVVGEIIVADLGISQKVYTKAHKTTIFSLEPKDMRLPFRDKPNVHKGSFGHLCVIGGDKIGAGILACQGALSTGAGLVTLLNDAPLYAYPEIMCSDEIPTQCDVVALGMGMGKKIKDMGDCQSSIPRADKTLSSEEPYAEYHEKELGSLSAITDIERFKNQIISSKMACVLDADMFYHQAIIDFLAYDKVVITPHPKEFVHLLRLLTLADIEVSSLQNNRLFFVELFAKNYPHICLLLKGANTMIAYKGQVYIQPLGTSALAKGGNGDVLAGIIGALLAQGLSLEQSAIQGSLIQAMSARHYRGNNFSLTPLTLINEIGQL